MTGTSIFRHDYLLTALGAVPVAMAIFSSWAEAQVPKEPLAVYSNVCFSRYSGDTRGSMLFLLSRPGEWDVLYEEADGWPQRPVLGRADIKDRQFHFEVTINSGRKLVFTGTITPEEIAGNFSGAEALHWKRRPADHSYAEDCPP